MARLHDGQHRWLCKILYSDILKPSMCGIVHWCQDAQQASDHLDCEGTLVAHDAQLLHQSVSLHYGPVCVMRPDSQHVQMQQRQSIQAEGACLSRLAARTLSGSSSEAAQPGTLLQMQGAGSAPAQAPCPTAWLPTASSPSPARQCCITTVCTTEEDV